MFTVPEANVELRVGGKFEICMRAPNGQDVWTCGHFTEIVPNARLVIEMGVADADRQALFTAHTVVTFSDEGGGTRLHVNQTYTVYQPIAEQMIKGARQGWAETLDRLEEALG
jgi:uncharacterized protein YndB with AHSA1/START domain